MKDFTHKFQVTSIENSLNLGEIHIKHEKNSYKLQSEVIDERLVKA